ncbi:MAG: hypothetical protein ACI9EW_001842 [Cellvibrionaceae bacterium]|jgi:uncharacterized protein (DUF2267 family)
MTVKSIKSIEDYYLYVQASGNLLTADHAARWSDGTLQMLGVNLSGRVKKALKSALPESLSFQLGRVFWVAYFRDPNMLFREFCTRVARRSRASSDPDFAAYPVQAIFGGLKALIDDDLSEKVRDDLSPELSKMWEDA